MDEPSHRHQLQSSILYPTTDVSTREAKIDVTDPVYGEYLGQVCLRPVILIDIEELVSSNTAAIRTKREALAKLGIWSRSINKAKRIEAANDKAEVLRNSKIEIQVLLPISQADTDGPAVRRQLV